MTDPELAARVRVEKPILFSAPMVRAILSGRKTQTRRVLKLPTKAHSGGVIYERADMGGWEPTTIGGGGCFTIGRGGERIPAPDMVGIWHRTCGVCVAARWQAGDRLWVREAWGFNPDHPSAPEFACFRADPGHEHDCIKWRPSIHMPRRACRIILEVTEVRVERLQDINNSDALDEGVMEATEVPYIGSMTCEMARHAYALLWDHINGAGSWDANPWIVAFTFRRVANAG